MRQRAPAHRALTPEELRAKRREYARKRDEKRKVLRKRYREDVDGGARLAEIDK